jgi:DnaJ-class molecular chaperone
MSYYTTLGITASTTQAEIKSAYRKLALIHHPDKNGDPIKFKEINNAYNILSDPTSKQNYDCFGDSPPEFDEQSNTYIIKIELTLEQLHSGYVHTQKIMSKSLCTDCIMHMETCPECSGSGQVVQLINLGPFTQQIANKCKACFCGQRKKENITGNKCNKCNGTCISVIVKKVEVKFQPGNMDLTKKLQMGDQLYLIIGELAKHSIYSITRSGNLECSLTLSLGESLTESFYKVLPFLDGKQQIIIAPDFIIAPGDKYVIRGKGITPRSDLIINFVVVFPERFSEKRKDYLKKIFGINLVVPVINEKAVLIKYAESAEGWHPRIDINEHQNQGHPQQCVHQ